MRQQLMKMLDFENEFQALISIEGTTDERLALCPFHDDKNPSLSINIKKGVYLCHACHAKGDFFAFYSKIKNISEADVVHDYAIQYGLLEGIDNKIVNEKNKSLLVDKKALSVILSKKGINKTTIEKFKIGYDGDRYWFPILDGKDNIINVIKYKLTSRRIKDKTLPYSKGRGTSVFPIANTFKKDDVFVFEGMTDCILGNQLGLNGITGTGGAGTWKPSWSQLLKDKVVYICYDADMAGKRGTARVARELYGIAKQVFMKFLPVSETKIDFNDFIVKMGNTKEDFLKLENIEYKGEDEKLPEGDKDLQVYPVTLDQASDAKYFEKRVKFKAVVAGKMLSPYLLPVEGKVVCKRAFTPDICAECPVTRKDFSGGYKISYEDHELLSMINVSSQVVKATIKRKIGIPRLCNKNKITRTVNINVEELTLVPEISHEQQESKHVTRIAYAVGQGVETNKTYEFTAITLPDPMRQLATHLIYEIKAAESNIDNFKLTPEIKEQLEKFRPKSWTLDSMNEKLAEIHSDYEAVTQIKKRQTLFTFIDLVYLSIRRFNFQKKEISKGYLDALVVGETRTGKSECIKLLRPHFKAGGRSSGECMSYSGLIGGLQQLHNGQWQINWGAVVLNDLGEYTIDEAHELGHKFWGQLSDYRSSGIININKIRTERAFGRTRLLSIANPPGDDKNFSQYANPVECIQYIVGRPEDVARFDMVMATLEEEVSGEIVNAPVGETAKIKTFTSELCHNRIMFAWSRDMDKVIFEPKAELEILKLAQVESSKFHSSIPIVQSSEQRIKLARIAVACASMFYSTDKTGEKILVKPIHVQWAHEFLLKIYSYPLSYDRYSLKKKDNDEIREPDKLKQLLTEDQKEKFLEWDQLKQQDLLDIYSDIREREKVREITGKLLWHKALRRVGTSYYVKTKAFVKFLMAHEFKSSKPKF